jgi:WD40 repeat protein
MFRWLVSCLVLCALTFGVVFLLADPLHLWALTSSPTDPQKPPKDKEQPVKFVDHPAEPVLPKVFDSNGQQAQLRPVIVTGAFVRPVSTQEVPSERPGRILFIARQLRDDELPLKQRIDAGDMSLPKFFSHKMRYVAINTGALLPVKEGDPTPPPQLRPWDEIEALEAGRVVIASESRYFRELGVGDTVQAGEILAVVNPAIALDELDIKKEKLTAAMAEVRTSAATKDEAWQRYVGQLNSNKRTPGTYSEDDVRGGKLTHERYVQEEIAKRAAYKQGQRELNATITQLKMHEIRAQISGVIKMIYKSRGDAVKEFDSMMQIQDLDHLRVEGLLEAQDANKVKKDDIVLIEPAIQDSPKKVLNGHLQEVTCVGVTKGDKPWILSGSEDRTLRGWDPATGEQTMITEHKTALRALACTRNPAERDLAVVGCSDGSVRLFDMDKMRDPNVADKKTAVKELSRRHTSAVTCVALSPSGKVCATGSEDLTICVWDTTTGELLVDKPLHAHKSRVTSVQFATDDTFVTAGGDNALIVWKFEKGKAPVRVVEFDKRSGDVPQLGVSSDGKHVLFDDGKDLRILSLESHQIVGTIQNSAGAGFRGLALFAPDGKTVLSTSASENRMQLWRTPVLEKKTGDDTMGLRAAELRQFVWTSGKENATAYAPDAKFIVTGTHDNQVLIWAMPDPKQIEERLTGKVSLVDKTLDASSRQVRIWAEVDNKAGWLVPGGTATIVIPPKK